MFHLSLITSWHKQAQDLQEWFKWYPTRRYVFRIVHSYGVVAYILTYISTSIFCICIERCRYGSENDHAAAAWELLRTTVYNYGGCGGFGGYHDGTGVEWKVWGAPPTCPAPTAANVSKAWALLVQAGDAISPVEFEPLVTSTFVPSAPAYSSTAA